MDISQEKNKNNFQNKDINKLIKMKNIFLINGIGNFLIAGTKKYLKL